MQTPTPTPIRRARLGGDPSGGQPDGALVERTVVVPRWLDAWLRAEHAACEAAGSLATERYFLSWLLDDGFVHFDRAAFVRATAGEAGEGRPAFS